MPRLHLFLGRLLYSVSKDRIVPRREQDVQDRYQLQTGLYVGELKNSSLLKEQQL